MYNAGEVTESAARKIFLLGLGAATLAFVGLAILTPAQGQTLFGQNAEPDFTASQAARGEEAYGNNCAECHGDDLGGSEFGPSIAGAGFQAQWKGQSADALYTYISSKMPPTSPGELSDSVYADIEAYLLQKNGVTASVHELAPIKLAGGVKGPNVVPNVERKHGNVLTPNHDAIYEAAVARRKAELDALMPVTAKMLENPPAGDWLSWRRSYNSLGYSPLKQINKSNVGRLREAWTWVLPVSADEITPVVHDGVIFIKSGDTVQALDGASGDLLWQYVRTLPQAMHNGQNERLKSIAIYQDKLFTPTTDGHIIALDIHTGKLLWDHDVLGARGRAHHLALDGGPIVAHGKVIMGASDCQTYKGGCFIVGLDANTGKEVWRFHTIARPGQPGGNSWNGAPVDERYGGSVWTSGSYDPKLNLVYFGTGQTYDTATLLQPYSKEGPSNDGLYTDSTVALDPDNGKLVWYYQHLNRDVWDFDWVFEQSLLTLPVHGKPTNLLVTGSKIAIFDALNRANGKYVFSRKFGIQNLVSSIDPKTGHKNINPKFKPEAGKRMFICPHAGGGRNWPATSYSPKTHILYVHMYETCMDFTWNPRSRAQTAAGGSDELWVLRPHPNSDGKFGRLAAMNLETGKIIWMDRQRAPFASSTLTTAGGLMFVGDRARRFRAFDASTGKVLWKAVLGAVPNSTPVTYTAHGKQYVALVAGVGGQVAWSFMTPELPNPKGGTTLWVFSLPDARDRSALQ